MINNLIFDGNYIFHKSIHALSKTNRFYTGLYDLLDMTVDKYVKMNNWNNVIIVSDSRKKSWRTQLAKDYKGTRVRDDSIDWEFAYETYEEWKTDISEKYHLFIKDHIEGDDWIFFLSKFFNKKGEGICTISSDKDMYQFVKADIDKKYMNVQISDKLNKEQIAIPHDWKLLYKGATNNITNPFDLDELSDTDFFDYITGRYKVVEVNSVRHVFEKILTGDRGDNVQSVHQTMTKTGKVRGIGEKTAEKVWGDYSLKHDTFSSKSEEDINNMIESYQVVKKTKYDNDTKDTIYENIKHNINMMELKTSIYPDDIKMIIVDEILDQLQYD